MINKKQYELLLEKKNRLKNQYYASFIWIIIDIIILFSFGVFGLIWIVILTLIAFISKSTPYQIKQQIEDVEIQLAGYKEKKTER